jgi:hypothetical protein
MHDGFYFRAGAGFAYGAANISSDRDSHPDYEVNGVGLGVDIMVGGSPSVGLALGGGVSFSGFGQDGAGGLFLMGVFVDGFPDPTGGWHLGGMLGLAGSSASDERVDDFRGGGFGLAAWVGHDFWVADEWSMGPTLRFNGAIARDPSEEDAPDPFVLSGAHFEGVLAFTVLYH